MPTALSHDERRDLAGSARAACDKLLSAERLRAVALETSGRQRGFDAGLWTALCSQVGIAAAAMPTSCGGAGYGTPALAVAAHELGRVLAPVPLLSFVLAAGLLVDAADDGVLTARLPALMDGERTAAVALVGNGGLWTTSAISFTARRIDGWHVTGSARHVLHGAAADDLVVVAAVDDAPALFLLDTGAAGVTAETETTLDGTRPMATIILDDAAAIRLEPDEPFGKVLDRNVNRVLTILVAEQVGTLERIVEITTDYARTRQQFGRPIGSFQAIKHRCADMLLSLEWARSAAQAALEATDDDGAESSWRASMAKAVCSEALRDAAHANIQIHGGIGFTWEDSAHLYLKRARTDEVLFGTPGAHWDRLTELSGLLAV
ncbi:acyl-CoA dehydrogenase family protein [Mycobacterium sp.]|uniref:acyl-CoA dehydrogenase family protein n=1 Tax=Mycobacterium sp. TaxID=1785 RepID=UPI0025E19BA8|nr:acyl-CoA dehydrogenase family protein [Mycobacterium sp.]